MNKAFIIAVVALAMIPSARAQEAIQHELPIVTVDVTDDMIDITLYNQAAPKPSDGKYDVYGEFVIDKSSDKKTFRDEGELAFAP